jgi:putative nucleotidyltransferase with HDIG domain
MPTAQALMENYDKVKTIPAMSARLIRMISSDKTTVRELEKAIKMDPSMVVRLLRMVNSSYYGLRNKVDSITTAVVYVGLKSLRNMIVVTSLKGAVKSDVQDDIFSKTDLWMHCAAVAVCSKIISERIFGKDGEDAFLCGILHDIGMIIEYQLTQDLFLEACKAYTPGDRSFCEVEREIIGADHCEVGYLLAQKIELSPEVQEAIRDHHSDGEEISSSSLVGIIQLAEYFVSKLGYTAISGMKAELSSVMSSYLRQNIDEYKVLAGDLPEELEKATEIYKVDGE